MLVLKEAFKVSAQKKSAVLFLKLHVVSPLPVGENERMRKIIDRFCSVCADERERERVHASRKVRSKLDIPSKTLAREDNTSLRSLSRRIQMPFLL